MSSQPTEFPRLPQAGAHVWVFSRPETAALAPDLTGTLSEAECSRARQYRFPKDANRFTACRAALRTLLSQYLGIDAAALVFTTGPNGKPRLCDHDLHFNVSHTNGMALLAFAASGPIGVDVEMIRPMPDRDELFEKYASRKEQSYLSSLPPEDKDYAFLQWWTALEASVKQTGEGLQAFETLSDFAYLTRSHAQPSTVGEQNLFLHSLPGNYVAAVAAVRSCQHLAWLDANKLLQGYEVPVVV